ncbi:autotransporter serine protease [Xanthomonas translucens pv. poae]|uniref:Autotransporter serine protease n=3 Tax=Xanthomonas translucens group TaxID=3390202 RepID=A0A0K2ZWA1_9XANT|nr:autotransporter serine protease [Xanthomonas translucens pv. poae]
MRKLMARSLLATALAVALTSCGGGGGGGGLTRSDPPPTSPPPSSPPPPPTSPPPPQPAFDAHLALTNTLAARTAGYDGSGYRIGVVDTGVNRNHPALAGRVVSSLIYVDPAKNNVNVDDVDGHGTTVAQLAAGKAVGAWPGGIAPGAQIVSARIISDTLPDDDGSGEGNQASGALGLASVHQDLINAGVKVMNNSWGGIYWTDPTATNAIAAEYRPFVLSHGGLVVFAAGNEAKADPSDIAALPSQPGPGGSHPAADLERGWLVVAAVDASTGSTLESYSNACGVAMRYCLVAPGTAVFVDPKATTATANPGYYYGSGTSYAAPLVSGAAALVWQAFPYFSNDLLRQTLLGTATDLGAPGVDATFGYGLLNVGKAVLGPARFDWGDVSVSFSGSSTWANDIAGSGGLIKQGSGTLTLSGTQNSYSGDTQVQAGTLSAASLSSNVAISNGATFIGTGPLRGNVSNAGTFQVGTAALSLSGNYVQASNGRLALLVGDTLSVSGTATLQGGALYVLGKRDYVVNNTAYKVLETSGGLSGTFASVTTPSNVFLTSSLSYDSSSASITVQALSVTAAAANFGSVTAATLASATRVDAAFAQLDAQLRQDPATVDASLLKAAGAVQQSPSAAAAAATLRSLSGAAHAAATAMTFDSIDLQRRALSGRLDSLVAQPRAIGEWSQRLGDTGQGSFAGSQFQLDGWMMGQDLRLGEHGVAGFAFGESRADGGGDGGLDHSRDRQVQGQAYLGAVGGHAYALAQLGTGQYRRQLDRGLLLGDTVADASSRYAGRFLSSSVEVGYRFGRGKASLTPYAGADYSRIDSDGFREQGGDGFGLMAAAASSSRSQALAGLRAGYGGRGWSLQGYAEWQQTLAAQGLQRQASFVGVDAWAPLVDLQPARSGGLFGASLDRRWGSSALGAGYDRRFGPRGDDHALSLRYRLGF